MRILWLGALCCLAGCAGFASGTVQIARPGQPATIVSVANPGGADLSWLQAAQAQLGRAGSAWGFAVQLTRNDTPPAGEPSLTLLDAYDPSSPDPHQQHVGYHYAGYRCVIYLRTATAQDYPVSQASGHELIEGAVDPNLDRHDAQGHLVEVCDPCGHALDPQAPVGTYLPDYTLPSYWDGGAGPYDAAGVIHAPGQVLPGGVI